MVSIAPMNTSQLSSRDDSATVGAFVKCFQITGIKNDLNSIKNEAKEAIVTGEILRARLDMVEDKIDKILSILSGEAAVSSATPALTNGNVPPFQIGGALYNSLSVCHQE